MANPKLEARVSPELHRAVHAAARRAGVDPQHIVREAIAAHSRVKRELAEPGPSRSERMYGHGPTIQREDER